MEEYEDTHFSLCPDRSDSIPFFVSYPTFHVRFLYKKLSILPIKAPTIRKMKVN